MTTAWIKMRVDLWDDPRIVATAAALGEPRSRVIGSCYRLWALADTYTVDGRLIGYSAAALDAAVELPGFSIALAKVGWLHLHADAVEIPRFADHNGASAKKRANSNVRMARSRAKCDASVALRAQQKAQPDSESESESEEEKERSDHLQISFKEERARRLMLDALDRFGNVDDAGRRFVASVAIGVSGGHIPESHFRSALEGARRDGVRNRIADFRVTLARLLHGTNGAHDEASKRAALDDLRELLTKIRVPDGFLDDISPSAKKRTPRSHRDEPRTLGSILSSSSNGTHLRAE